LLDFPARAEQANRPQMAAGLAGLLGGSGLEGQIPPDWLSAWQSAFEAAASTGKAEARIHAARLNYYSKAFEAMAGGENPTAALWPLLHTWTLSALVLDAEKLQPWRAACEKLGLTGAAFEEKVQGLDQYLDEVEILLDEIASANGLQTAA
jgi:hypothetical protein